MPQYLNPGVYIEETGFRTKSIVGVSTGVTGFVGRTEHIKNAVLDNNTLLDKPVLIQSWADFVEKFGKYNKRQAPWLPPVVKGFFDNGGRKCYVVRVRDNAGDKDFIGMNEKKKKTGLQALCAVDDISIVCIPGMTSQSVQQAMISHCETTGDRVCVLDSKRNAGVNNVLAQRGGLHSSKGYGALYYPWIKFRIETGKKNRLRTVQGFVPPSGHIAGIYARTDSERGVHKAPANRVVRGVLELKVSITNKEQGLLNPEGVNCIRTFPGKGILVWGDRTISDDPEWKYVNVRRLFLYLEKSIDKGMDWVVFEPNGETLWADVRRNIENFLADVWRTGMLQGSKPEEAFFVKCVRTTMTRSDIDNGELVCVVGVAPVKPAEFLIFRINKEIADRSV